MKKFYCPELIISISVFAQTGYEIKVTFKPFKKQYIYLGHYFGKQYPIIDSAMLNDKSEAVFKGKTKLPGGIYLIGYPNKAGFFEVLVDKQQKFSVIADTATLKKEFNFLIPRIIFYSTVTSNTCLVKGKKDCCSKATIKNGRQCKRFCSLERRVEKAR